MTASLSDDQIHHMIDDAFNNFRDKTVACTMPECKHEREELREVVHMMITKELRGKR